MPDVHEGSNAVLQAQVRDGGWVAVWDDERQKPKTAWRIDPRVLDHQGRELEVALAAGEPGVSLPSTTPR
ncbi:MAG TPA: hypothetical protein VFT33_01180 [Gaiellaceae bacterium]|nr:hypothetical protein [Gaiellaceae bacterium]